MKTYAETIKYLAAKLDQAEESGSDEEILSLVNHEAIAFIYSVKPVDVEYDIEDERE